MSLSSHQSARMKCDVWLTPEWILKPLGAFDLDPCSPPHHPWQIAPRIFTVKEDGLAKQWIGRVWCNPPFGNQATLWLARMADHGNGIALVAARTETQWFQEHIWKRSDAICFLNKRPYFHREDGTRGPSNSGAPICLVAYGASNAETLQQCGLGYTVSLTPTTL